MANENIGTPDQLKDPDYEIPMGPRTAPRNSTCIGNVCQ